MHAGEGLPAAGHVHVERGHRGEAVAIAVEVGRCIRAGAVIVGGGSIVVAGSSIGTTVHAAGCLLEAVDRFNQLALVSVREHLDVQLATDLPIRGQLGKQDFLVRTRDAVGAARQDVPSATNGRADVHIAACAEAHLPGSDVRIHEHGNIRFTVSEDGLLIDTDGHPAVVRSIREGAVVQRVDGSRRRSSQRILIEGCRRVEEQRIGGITNAG